MDPFQEENMSFQISEEVDGTDQQAEMETSEPVDTFDFDAFMDTPLTALPRNSGGYDKDVYQNYSQAQVIDPQLWEPQTYLAPAPTNIPQAQTNQDPESASVQANIPQPFPQREPTPISQRGQREGMLYLNPILNSFSDPSVPLRIIDRFQYPFQQELREALEGQLTRITGRPIAPLNSRQVQARIPTVEDALWGMPPAERASWRPESRPMVPDHRQYSFVPDFPPPQTAAYQTRSTTLRVLSPAPSSPGSVTMTKKMKNRRSSNIKNFNPADYYQPLGYVPSSWLDGKYPGELIFQYNEHGELLPDATYTPQQIVDFISFHPLNTFDGKKSGLTLWIQVAPADSGKRYGHKNSDKCRFHCCPDPVRTIRKGDFRIAFDEQYAKGINTDPFHNAGYVHLYCMEKFIDFPSICQNYNVRPDVRKLREGKNKMALTRDHNSMEDIALEFIRDAKSWPQFNETGLRPVDYYEHTLCYKLTVEHLNKQPKHLQKIRERRGGNSIERHLNNLDKYLEGRKQLENERKAGLRPPIGGVKGSKRKAQDRDDEEEFELDDGILDGDFGSADRDSTSRSRKRARMG